MTTRCRSITGTSRLFHRSVDFCGSCHDVSNPVVGDLAPNNGAQQPLDPGTFDGQLDTPSNPRNIEDKAAFNNPPYKYGVVERTYSEYKASLLSQTLVSDYLSLPADLQDGSIQVARGAALGRRHRAAITPTARRRYFSCQTCHMPATTALGCNKAGVPLRYRPADARPDRRQLLDAAGHAVHGRPGHAAARREPEPGRDHRHERRQRRAPARISRTPRRCRSAGNTLRVVNLTGHKLISGYPEGRRMWLNIVWKDGGGATIREDGAYGPLQLSYDITGDAVNDTVDTLLDLNDPNTKVYEAHGAITQAWASKLLAVSASYGAVPVAYDRVTGAVTHTVADVAALNPGEYHETFHFVLNNKVVKDNRIPPYGMAYDESLTRSILPVPATQYGVRARAAPIDYWDDFALNPPARAMTADISLMYQPTSWEYIQFLDHANDGSIAFLANEGANMLDAWLNTGMAAPHAMASAQWVGAGRGRRRRARRRRQLPERSEPAAGEQRRRRLGRCLRCRRRQRRHDRRRRRKLRRRTPGYNPGTDPDPFNPDTDGDGHLDGADPVPLHFNYADGDVGPFGARDTEVNVSDLLVCVQFAIGLKEPTDEDLAHGDLYPVGAPDGEIGLADLFQLQKLLLD